MSGKSALMLQDMDTLHKGEQIGDIKLNGEFKLAYTKKNNLHIVYVGEGSNKIFKIIRKCDVCGA